MKLTSITEQNKDYFRMLCTEDAFAELRLPEHCGIGAVAGERPAYIAVGLLCFHVIERDDVDDGYAVIDSICVAEDYRRQGIGRAMIRELIRNLREMDVESVYIDLPEKGLSDLEHFFTACGFLHEWMESDTYLVSLGTAKEWLGKIPDIYPGDLPLGEAEVVKLKRTIEESLRDVYIKGVREILLQSWEDLEREVSIVHSGKRGYDAFALFQRMPSGRLILRYFGGTDEVTCDLMHQVICDAITMAHLYYKRKTILEIPVRSEQEDEFLHMIFPQINRRRVRRFATGGF